MIEGFIVVMGAISIGYYLMKLLSDKIKQRKARRQQLEKDRVERLHQKKLEQNHLRHQAKMQEMDIHISMYDQQMQEIKDQIISVKCQQA